MKLAFEINDELDLADEVPSLLNNISTLVLALPHLQKATNMNSDVMINAGYFLSGVIDDIAEAVTQYAEKKLTEKRGGKEMILVHTDTRITELEEQVRFLKDRFENLQRAVRAAHLGFKTIDELADEAHALNQGIFWDYVENADQESENQEQREEIKK